jgi:hypothetical protein
MAVKKCLAVRLGVINDSKATNRKLGGLPAKTPSSLCSPIDRLGVIYDSDLARIYKNTTTNRWILLLFIEKIAYYNILIK